MSPQSRGSAEPHGSVVISGGERIGRTIESRNDMAAGPKKIILDKHSSPWQNPFVERFIGSLRRECLNHVILLSESHLKRIVEDYLDYYHNCRTHLSLHRNAPNPREQVARDMGPIVSIPRVGGLHHEYRRAA